MSFFQNLFKDICSKITFSKSRSEDVSTEPVTEEKTTSENDTEMMNETNTEPSPFPNIVTSTPLAGKTVRQLDSSVSPILNESLTENLKDENHEVDQIDVVHAPEAPQSKTQSVHDVITANESRDKRNIQSKPKGFSPESDTSIGTTLLASLNESILPLQPVELSPSKNPVLQIFLKDIKQKQINGPPEKKKKKMGSVNPEAETFFKILKGTNKKSTGGKRQLFSHGVDLPTADNDNKFEHFGLQNSSATENIKNTKLSGDPNEGQSSQQTRAGNTTDSTKIRQSKKRTSSVKTARKNDNDCFKDNHSDANSSYRKRQRNEINQRPSSEKTSIIDTEGCSNEIKPKNKRFKLPDHFPTLTSFVFKNGVKKSKRRRYYPVAGYWEKKVQITEENKPIYNFKLDDYYKR